MFGSGGTKLSATFTEERVVDADPDLTKARFVDFDAIMAATTEAEQITREGDDVLFFQLPTQQHGPVSFRPEYRVRYTLRGDTLVWETIGDSNMASDGQAVFAPSGAGTKVTYEQRITINLKVNRVLAKMVRPVLERMIGPGVKGYLDRMTATL